MGKHKKDEKHKSLKRKKDKKKEKKRRYNNSSSSEDEWVEKKTEYSSSSEEEKIQKAKNKKRSSSESSSSSNKEERKYIKSNTPPRRIEQNREDWMTLPSSFLSVSNLDKRREREEVKRLENERKQYNPRECSRELNPYWKDGGDGLPKFKKPSDNLDNSNDYKRKSVNVPARIPQWKKQKSEQLTTNRHKESEKTIDETDKILSEKELNALAAKLVKAEIIGNTKLINELKEKLDSARKARECAPQSNVEEVILTHTDSKGLSRPVKLQSEYGESSGYHKRKKNIETHKDGERIRYFADDDRYSLKQMFENEKYNTVEDHNNEFVRMAGKIRKNDDLDDVFSDNIRKKESDHKVDARNRDRAVSEHQKVSKSLDNCSRCIQSDAMLKHLMISMGETVYLSLPSHEPLTDGHCKIIPIRHVVSATQLDENEWEEVMNFRKALTRLFDSQGEDVIFFETAMYLYKHPHMCIECVPMPKEQGDLAPIYFKKAIDESEVEWSQNKKLVSLKGRNVRKAVPKGLPYFSVSFGVDEGYAHVVEDEQLFPGNFAQEIIGGMLDLHHSKWKKPKRQSFEEQSKRVMAFSREWSKFDCTLNK